MGLKKIWISWLDHHLNLYQYNILSIEKCIICGSSDTSVFVHLHSNNLIVLKCKNCRHIFVNNSPINADNISEFYTMEDFKGKRTLQEFEYSNYYNHEAI